MRAHGPWVIESSTDKYTSEFVNLQEDRVKKPDGSPGLYATVTLKPGVAMLPLDADGQVHLTRQFRYALGRESVEVASGGREAGEAPLAAAQREIREELGLHADEWTSLGSVDLETSIVHCSVDLFLARGLHQAETDRDATEVIRPLTVSLDAAIDMVLNGDITDATSCVLILKAGRFLG